MSGGERRRGKREEGRGEEGSYEKLELAGAGARGEGEGRRRGRGVGCELVFDERGEKSWEDGQDGKEWVGRMGGMRRRRRLRIG